MSGNPGSVFGEEDYDTTGAEEKRLTRAVLGSDSRAITADPKPKAVVPLPRPCPLLCASRLIVRSITGRFVFADFLLDLARNLQSMWMVCFFLLHLSSHSIGANQLTSSDATVDADLTPAIQGSSCSITIKIPALGSLSRCFILSSSQCEETSFIYRFPKHKGV